MLEKNSSLVLTDDDIQQYNAGVVSKRIEQSWSLSLEDLGKLIASNNYITITTKEETQHDGSH